LATIYGLRAGSIGRRCGPALCLY